jgi:hypothetical protein
MAENSGCGKLMGFLLIAFPIIALVFGSDEPAMQTDNAAIVMTGMIFVGIIMLGSSNKKKTQAVRPVPTRIQRREQSIVAARYATNPQPSSQMVHGSTTGTHVETRILVICPYCGAKNEQGILRCQNCSAEL